MSGRRLIAIVCPLDEGITCSCYHVCMSTPNYCVLVCKVLDLLRIRLAPVAAVPIHMVANFVTEQMLNVEAPKVRRRQVHKPNAVVLTECAPMPKEMGHVASLRLGAR